MNARRDGTVEHLEGYGTRNPTWHEEDAPHKAEALAAFVARLSLPFRSVADVGCGTGEVLRRFKARMDADGRWQGATYQGWDLEEEAIARAGAREEARLSFVRGDFTVEGPEVDLILCVDTLEHVGDDVAFLRGLAERAPWVVLRIPLELSVLDVLRPGRTLQARVQWGHRHAYTRELAFAVLEEAGLDPIGWRIDRVPPRIERLGGRISDGVRRAVMSVAPEAALSWLGGYSILVVARSERREG